MGLHGAHRWLHSDHHDTISGAEQASAWVFVALCRRAGVASYRLMRSLRLPSSNRGVIRIAVSQSDAPGSLDNLAAETGDGDLLLLDRDSFNLTSASDQASPLVDEGAGLGNSADGQSGVSVPQQVQHQRDPSACFTCSIGLAWQQALGMTLVVRVFSPCRSNATCVTGRQVPLMPTIAAHDDCASLSFCRA